MCTDRQIFHLLNYQSVGQDKILSYQDLFVKYKDNQGNSFVTFSSLTIKIHIRILETLLKKFLSNSYMLQTPRLFQGFSYNLHCLVRHDNYSLYAFKFFICCQIKTNLIASTIGENISNNVRNFTTNPYALRHKLYLIYYDYSIAYNLLYPTLYLD